MDWFHITMRITVMTNMARSLHPPPPAADPDPELSPEAAARLITGVRENLGRLKWFLWHGNVFRALTTVDGLIGDLEILQPDEREPGKLLAAVRGARVRQLPAGQRRAHPQLRRTPPSR